MKVRKGFVSNSSSSSFIIGVGVIKDIDKFKEIAKKDGIDVCEKSSYHGFEIMRRKDIKSDQISEESFLTDTKLSLHDVPEDSWLFKYYHSEGDDSDFTVYDKNGYFQDIDYDIDTSFFCVEAQAAIALMENPCVQEKDWTFGAGRNG